MDANNSGASQVHSAFSTALGRQVNVRADSELEDPEQAYPILGQLGRQIRYFEGIARDPKSSNYAKAEAIRRVGESRLAMKQFLAEERAEPAYPQRK